MQKTFRAYTRETIHTLPQWQHLSAELQEATAVVGRVFPFRTNRYMVDEVIDWKHPESDPMYRLNFPNRDMLQPHHYQRLASLLHQGETEQVIARAVREIRQDLNPHSVQTMDATLPIIDGLKQQGIIHSYPETVLFFAAEGQMCHAHCTFCFRWLQFVGGEKEIFVSTDINALVQYVAQHQEVRDILFTGGDPMVMPAHILAEYVDKILAANIPHLNAIRFGTKAITYWPYRFLTDPDADSLLQTFERIIASGKHLAIVANMNHPRELATPAVQQAVQRIRATGAEIRAQSPLLRHINAEATTWVDLWQEQVRLGIIPYYQFIVRDTGARHYFRVPLVEALEIYRTAWGNVSGICRTARGPCMSTPHGKVQVVDVQEINGKPALLLRYLQSPDAAQVLRIFCAEYDANADWFSDLRPLRPQDVPFFSPNSGSSA
ncbi:KamA family radical SAM protein [Chrysiogenes arsenatis]|uniref:KamA family radical SAM protein n=1 Tax=Chrysiogenes arsenatis TaxID=309797 RepID=UPI000406BB5F|nr:4Fe-4S cluster-binding domain-containing protein [Chrysiogenes arsenatis]